MQQYSPKNQQFILSQLPTATDVRSFKAWKAAGRSVIKGEKALRVWIPKRGAAIPADLSTMTEAQEREYFVRGPVFDISQTKPCAPRHKAAANTERQIGAELDAMDRAYADYDAAIAAGEIPADLDFDIWYELRAETRIATARGEITTTIPASSDYTIATPAGVVIAQVEHHDLYPPVSGGSDEADEQETAGAVSDRPECPGCQTYAAFCQCDHPRYVVNRYNSTHFEVEDTQTGTAPHVNLTFEEAAGLMRTLNAQEDPEPEPPAIAATAADLFATAGVSAYRWNSFNPEERAAQDQREFEHDVALLLDAYTPLATTDRQQDILNAELTRYMDTYLKHKASIYAARGRTASTMVTGGSNFNHRRNQKYLDLEHRRVTEFLAWEQKARAAIKRAILDARTEAQKADEIAAELITWAMRELDTLDKITRAESGDGSVPSWYAGMNKSSFTTSFTSKLHREAKNGRLAEVQACLRWLDEQQQTTGRQLITKRNRVWNYLDQDPTETTPAQESAVLYAADGVTVTANYAADRYQIQHDEKPDADTRATLKAHGWHWSRQNAAWQRQITNAALYNLTQIVPGFTA